MTGKELKNSILQLAISGKLVPQDPSDEPASVLLKRIRKEKEQLVKEGKLKKKDLVSEPIGDDEKAFEIPESWEWVRLSSLVELITKGSSPSWQGIKYTDKGILFITSENVGVEKLLLENPKHLEPSFNCVQSRSILRKGDILTNIVGASIGRSAIYDLEVCDANINQAVAIIRFSDLALIDFFVKLFNSQFLISSLIGKTVETARPNLSLASLASLTVPLPPLAEQRRIVAKIEELMPLIDEYDKAQAELDKLNTTLPEALKKSILQQAICGKLVPQDPTDEPASELIKRIRKEKEQLVKQCKLKKKDLDTTPITDDEKPFEIPDNWQWCRLVEICSFLSRGKSPSYSDTPNEYPVFAQKCNLKEGGISLEQARFLKADSISKWPEEYHLKNGDVLINSTGTGTVCRTRLFNDSVLEKYPFTVPDSHVSVARTFDSIDSAYIYYLFNSKVYQDYWEDRLAGSTNQKELYIGVLQESVIPLPPLAEQHRIVTKIEQLFALIDK